jgi:serine/threonine protein kinase
VDGGLVTAKLCDVGLAERLIDPETVALELDGYGISGWEAPETLCHAQVSRASDVYSLASLMFSLWTVDGRSPWSGLSRSAASSADADAGMVFKGLFESQTNSERPHVLSCFHDHEWARVPAGLQGLMRRCVAYRWDGSGCGADDSPLRLRPSCPVIVEELEGILASSSNNN